MAKKTKPRAAGRWEESHAPWYEPTAVYCDGCGMLIPNRRFEVEEAGKKKYFCQPDCAEIQERISRTQP